MTVFDFSFINVIITIFLIILAGIAINRVFHIDIKTLTKLQFYLLMPSMLFVKIYESELSVSIVRTVIVFAVIVMFLVMTTSLLISKFRGYTQSETSVFVNTSTYFNAGNYSLPLMQLLFNDPLAISVQVIIMMVQNIIFFTIGIFTAGAGKRGPKKALMYVLKMPLIYVMIIAVIMKTSGIKIWNPIWDSMSIIADSYSGVALLTLGAQLAETKFNFKSKRLYLSNFIRLIVAPVIGFIVVSILGVTGMVARVLVIAMGAPTAVNVVLSAIELDNEPKFAAQAVFTSTIISLLTISLVIFTVFQLIPA
ncbi:MAG: AEC family transporter [Gudongella sp.]|nr:AEC family transporter [Gudongella sp.]